MSGFDPVLGLMASSGGRVLSNVPPTATREEQIAAINNIVAALNNFSRDVVASGSTVMTLSSESSKVVTIPHSLGYKPRAFVYLDNVSLTIDGVLYPNINFPLPTYLGSTAGAGTVTFSSWLDYFVDSVNLYLHLQSGLNLTGNLPFKYVLTRDPAN